MIAWNIINQILKINQVYVKEKKNAEKGSLEFRSKR